MGKKGLSHCKYNQKCVVGRGRNYPKQLWAEMCKRSHLFFHLNADMTGSALYAVAKFTQNSFGLKWVKMVHVIVNMNENGL